MVAANRHPTRSCVEILEPVRAGIAPTQRQRYQAQALKNPTQLPEWG